MATDRFDYSVFHFPSFLDNTIVADVQSPIIEKFGEVGKLSWLGVAFVLASSATIITWYMIILFLI